MPHDAYFQGNPTRLDVSRSKMHAAPRWSGSWNTGRLFPIFATSSVMPGDTFKMSVASAIRMTRPVVPVMDDMDITIEAFFVPHRLILSRKSMSPDLNDGVHSWSAFIGAQDSYLNMPTPGDIKLGTCQINQSGYVVGGVADCLGYHVPQVSGGSYQVNPLKILAFYNVWNEYFREPNTQYPVTFTWTASASSVTGNFISVIGTDANIAANTYIVSGVGLPPVSRYHGYFGSALPWPQRNSSTVTMPLGSLAPVVARDVTGHAWGDTPAFNGNTQWHALSGSSINPVSGNSQLGLVYDRVEGADPDVTVPYIYTATGSSTNNLFADLSTATAASVNQFRLAVQTQRWYEALARSGNKYSDLVDGMFGVRGPSIPDRPEYLGGFTAPINISQVNGTSGTDLGATGAFSLSNPSGYLFTKSFTEHGTIIVVACCRVRESFSQGVKKEDQRYERFDFYWPQFANLGEEPLYKKYLYVDGTSTDDEVFGYQEAWAEYRMFTDDVTGYMNPTVSGGIGQYTYANKFSGAPTLKGYLDASSQVSNVDRTLTVDAATAGFQFFGQFQFDIEMVRPMPTYSIPGLVDHH